VTKLGHESALSSLSDAGPRELVCVIDDDEEVRFSLDSLLRSAGYAARTFANPQEFLDCADDASCLILDVRLNGACGLAFQEELIKSESIVPIILVTGHGDIPMSVRAMRAGALTFLTKPFKESEIIDAVRQAVEQWRNRRSEAKQAASLRERYESLTAREREVMALVTAGLMNKQMAGRLGVQEITVKIHRGNVMHKMCAQSLPDLVRMAETLGVRETSVSRYARAPDSSEAPRCELASPAMNLTSAAASTGLGK
jgi:FixJ family two-component response regulator